MAQITLNSSGVASNGTLALQSNGTTTAVTIDASQNVGVGTASPAISGLEISRATGSATPTPAELRISTTTNESGWSTTDPWGRLSFYSADASVGGAKVQASIQTTAQSSSGGNSKLEFFVTDTANGTLFKTLSFQGAGTNTTQTLLYSGGGTEAMRIDSSGNLLVGATSGADGRIKIDGTLNAVNCAVWAKNSAGASSGTYVCWNAATSGNNQFIDFYTETAATSRGSLYYDRAANQTKLLATSDQRLKENIVDAPAALPVVSQIKVRQYDWKETGSTNIGFVAQELHQVVERAVAVGEDNEDGSIKRPWGVDNVTLVPYLVKAIQEQQAIITALQADVAALKGTA